MLHSSQPHMNPHQGNNAPLPSHQAQVHGQGAMMGSSLMTHMASSVPNKTYVPSSAAPQPYHGSTSYTSMGGGGGGAEGGPSSSSSLHGCGSGSGSGPMMSGGILGYGPLSSSFTPSSQGAAVGTGVGSVGFGLGGSSRPEDQANAALAALALKHQQAQASRLETIFFLCSFAKVSSACL